MTFLAESHSPVLVSASRFVPLTPDRVLDGLRRDVPGTVLESEEGVGLRFAHEGTKGWLPFERMEGEYRVSAEGTGTRLAFTVAAWPTSPESPGASAVSGRDVLEKRLRGYVDGALASRSASLLALARAA